MNSNKIRQSNFELMRIISMFFIVLWHIIIHGHLIENSLNPKFSFIITLLKYIVIVHVNSYVLLTGYFQCKSKFKLSKIWDLSISSLFYKLIIIIIFSYFSLLSLSKIEIFRELLIINYDEYWFIKMYIYLYLLSPFLNKFINDIDKKYYNKLLITLFIILSIIPFFTNNRGFDNTGYTLYSFVFLYFIGAYLRLYNIKESYLFKLLSNNLYRIILVFLFLFITCFNYLLGEYSVILQSQSVYMNEFFSNFSQNFNYSSPIIIIQSIVYFLFFENINFKNKFINKISSLTLGIYLISDNIIIRSFIYDFIGLRNHNIEHFSYIIHVFILSILIFIICLIIEFIRQCIFKFIRNRKKYIMLKDKINNFPKTIYLKK